MTLIYHHYTIKNHYSIFSAVLPLDLSPTADFWTDFVLKKMRKMGYVKSVSRHWFLSRRNDRNSRHSLKQIFPAHWRLSQIFAVFAVPNRLILLYLDKFERDNRIIFDRIYVKYVEPLTKNLLLCFDEA